MKSYCYSTVAHKGHAFSVEIYCCSVEIDLLRALPAVLRANLSLLRAKSVAPYKHTKLLHTKIELLRGKLDASPHKSNASPWKIRCSAQIECFSVENSIFLRTNQKLLGGKFDVSQCKSKVPPCKIRCFSVQIESDRNLLRGKLHSELGDLGSPPGQQIAEIMFRGREVVLFVKTFFLSLRNGVVLPSLRRTFSRKC